MKLEIKYTTEGKKVVVIGSLNSQEKIVQEIFIVNGNEIPSGENFVVKSLHDAPAVSWKEDNLKKIEANYENRKSAMETELKRLKKTYDEKSTLLRGKLDWAAAALKNASPESFEMLVDYITGNISHVVSVHYGDVEIFTLENFNQTYEDKLRLISFFGKDDGTFCYKIGQYYDYSGSNNTFIPCRTYDEAIAKATAILTSVATLTGAQISTAGKYNISLDKEKIAAHKSRKVDNLKAAIEKYKAEMAKAEDSIAALTNS